MVRSIAKRSESSPRLHNSRNCVFNHAKSASISLRDEGNLWLPKNQSMAFREL